MMKWVCYTLILQVFIMYAPGDQVVTSVEIPKSTSTILYADMHANVKDVRTMERITEPSDEVWNKIILQCNACYTPETQRFLNLFDKTQHLNPVDKNICDIMSYAIKIYYDKTNQQYGILISQNLYISFTYIIKIINELITYTIIKAQEKIKKIVYPNTQEELDKLTMSLLRDTEMSLQSIYNSLPIVTAIIPIYKSTYTLGQSSAEQQFKTSSYIIVSYIFNNLLKSSLSILPASQDTSSPSIETSSLPVSASQDTSSLPVPASQDTSSPPPFAENPDVSASQDTSSLPVTSQDTSSLVRDPLDKYAILNE